MVDKTKLSTISVRVEEDLNQKTDLVTAIIGVNKSDFLRACLEKLCVDNQMLLDHCDKFEGYINFIKQELSALPPEMILVNDGSWSDVTDFLILMLCDKLWKMDIIKNYWKEFTKKYDLRRSHVDADRKPENTEELFDLEGLVFLSAEKSGLMPPEDVSSILTQVNWINNVEADKISLVFAVKKSFEEQTALSLIKEYLTQAEEKHGKPSRIIIDAKGKFRRVGDWLYYPVYTAELSNEGTGEE